MVIHRLCSNPGVAAAALPALPGTAGAATARPRTPGTPPECGQWTDRWSVLGTALSCLPLDGNQGSLPIAAGGGAGRRSPKNAGRLLNLEYR
jgi:hypothetical protein